jgi:hypothetical protein
MRSFACRRLGSLALARRSGPANITIAQATFTLSDHRGHHAHAALSAARAAAGEGRPPVIFLRRQTTDCGGPAGETVRPSTQTSGMPARLLFALRRMGGEPACAADAVGWTNSLDARAERLARPKACDDMALTHDKGWMMMAPRACLDARAAVPGRIFAKPSGRDVSVHQGSLRAIPGTVMAPVGEATRRRHRRDAAGEELAARQFATTASLRSRGRRRKPPRCLKPRATSLEATGGRDSRAEQCGRRKPGAAAPSTSQDWAFCRVARDHGCRLMQRNGLSAPSGWLRRPG